MAKHPKPFISLVTEAPDGELLDLGSVRVEPLMAALPPSDDEFYEEGEDVRPQVRTFGRDGTLRLTAELDPAALGGGRLPDVVAAIAGGRRLTLYFGGAAEEICRARVA